MGIRALLLLTLFICSLSDCSKRGKDEYSDLASRIMPLSGNNKGEIYKIINTYRNEKNDLKYRAALYVLKNMASQFHYEGQNIARYRSLFDSLQGCFSRGTIPYDQTWDSLQTTFDFTGDQTLVAVSDLRTITAAGFTNQIEASFRAWNYPWARSLDFESFCRYLLPFKLGNEEPEDWKDQVQKKYQWVADSLKDTRDAKKVCLLLNDDLKRTFYINARFKCSWWLNYTDLCKLHTGDCGDATQLTAYIMRAMGVPVVMEYVPCWGNKNGGHAWNALIDHDRSIDFIGSETDPGMDKIEFTKTTLVRRKRPKVFRRTFEDNKDCLALQIDSSANIPDLFHSTRLMDVTKEYVPVADVSLYLSNIPDNQKFVYLYVFNDNEWKPVDWSPIGFLGKVHFHDMGRDILYLPAYYEDGDCIPAKDPFILTKKGDIEQIRANPAKRQTIVIYEKYPEDKSNYITKGESYELFYWDGKWVSLGQQQATADSLVYPEAPSDALYWVRDLDKGRQERIFTYSGGKQVWW